MRIGLTLAIAIAFLTGCSRARLITEVHNDGGFTRTLALTGQDKKNSQGSMGDAIEAAVLTVTKTLQSIAVTPTAASVAVGATQQFTAIGTYSDGTTANITTTVNWNSSNTSVATIAATYSDGSTVNITNSVTWSSSNTTTATIAATGLATGLAKGTTNITATLNGITSNTAVLTVTVPSGEPAVTITLLDQSSTGPGFYVDLQVTNTGVGPASNLSINQITFRTLGGTGTVTQVSPALPIAVGALAPSASTTIRVFLNVPSTVTRFSMGEAGTVQDTNATTFNYAWPAVAKRNLPNSTPSSRNVGERRGSQRSSSQSNSREDTRLRHYPARTSTNLCSGRFFPKWL